MRLSGLLLSLSRRWSVVEHAYTSVTTAFTWEGTRDAFWFAAWSPSIYQRRLRFRIHEEIALDIPITAKEMSASSSSLQGITLCPYRRLMGKQPLLSVLSIRSSYKHYRFITAVTAGLCVCTQMSMVSLLCFIKIMVWPSRDHDGRVFLPPRGTCWHGKLLPYQNLLYYRSLWNPIYFSQISFYFFPNSVFSIFIFLDSVLYFYFSGLHFNG